MIRNDLDIGIITQALKLPRVQLDKKGALAQVFNCDVFNTETGHHSRHLKLTLAFDEELPVYVGIPHKVSVPADTILTRLDLISTTSEERAYLALVEKKLNRQKRDFHDAFGANGRFGLARAWLSIAYYTLRGKEPDLSPPPPLVQRIPGR